MMLYLDTSAYVKNYVAEAGRDHVTRLMTECEALACHELGQVEVYSAFERACREGRLGISQLRRLQEQFQEDWAATLVVRTTDRLLREACAFLQRFPLRAYDAMHLAAACALKEATGASAPFVFAGFDAQQNRAARQLGLVVPEAFF